MSQQGKIIRKLEKCQNTTMKPQSNENMNMHREHRKDATTNKTPTVLFNVSIHMYLIHIWLWSLPHTMTTCYNCFSNGKTKILFVQRGGWDREVSACICLLSQSQRSFQQIHTDSPERSLLLFDKGCSFITHETACHDQTKTAYSCQLKRVWGREVCT